MDVMIRLLQWPFMLCQNQATYSISTGVPSMSLHFIYIPQQTCQPIQEPNTNFPQTYVIIQFSVENNLILLICVILASLPSNIRIIPMPVCCISCGAHSYSL